MSALSLRRDPFRLALSTRPWASAWYLFSYQFVDWLLFAIAFTAAVTGAVLSVTLAGLPVLVAAAVAIRWCANVERARLRTVEPEPVRGRYREAARPGVMAQLRARWRDSATWRDVAYLLGLFVPLAALDLVVLTVWLVFLAAFLLFNYVLVATARAHAAVVRGLLGSPEDPLREAKEILRRPGPLRTFMPN
ncbi:MAG TPA: sensor domain-containing protein [Trebonia sp.]